MTLTKTILPLLPASMGQLRAMTGATVAEIEAAVAVLKASRRAYVRRVEDLGGREIVCPIWRTQDLQVPTAVTPVAPSPLPQVRPKPGRHERHIPGVRRGARSRRRAKAA